MSTLRSGYCTDGKCEIMKRRETVIIENVLRKSLFGSNPKLAKEYGTTEVTIGFQRNNGGRELVDFLSYDPKNNIFRCYEIKVSMSDFHSSAAKSWYGHYNYLVLSEDLYREKPLLWWKSQVPESVGILVVNTDTEHKQTVKKPVKSYVDDGVCNMLKDSLIRTLFYQTVR